MYSSRQERPEAQTPTAGRYFLRPALCAGSLILALSSAHAEAPDNGSLTEAEAVRMARERPALREVRSGNVAMARASRIEARLWSNPEVSYSREQLFGSGGGVDDYLSVTQPLDLSGRRRFRSRAASQRVQAAELEGEALLRSAATRARLYFYAALYQQRRAEAIRTWVARTQAAVDTVRQREAAGDASAYDRLRLERELESGRSLLMEVEADLGSAWFELEALWAPQVSSGPRGRALEGVLLPEDAPPSMDQLIASVDMRPSLRAMAATADAARLESKAASRGWVPGLSLGVGWKSSEVGSDRLHGFTALASISIPVFDRGQAAVARTAAEERQIRGRMELARAEAAGAARALWTGATGLVDGARKFRETTQAASTALLGTVEAAYRGGELGVLELADAYRGALDDELRALALELKARRARIELDFATGGNR